MKRSDRVQLDTTVALRPERFGALAYSYRDRQLLFIDRTVLPFVDSGGERPVGEIADELVAEGHLDADRVRHVFVVLEGLRRKGFVNVV
ncbi:MAG: mycofactocin biosynthesis chaperone MftB [bacterium]|jgi:putative mycofactocin binding protein MftB|nr:mycofactocin biosynthesis chaperone MftB [Candidatus Dormibacteraeota bacterium]MDR0358645.1 mycofactocin biosynthesis chaperone MftB [bacterium]